MRSRPARRAVSLWESPPSLRQRRRFSPNRGPRSAGGVAHTLKTHRGISRGQCSRFPFASRSAGEASSNLQSVSGLHLKREAVNALFRNLFDEQTDAGIRTRNTEEPLFRVTVGLAAFESPMSEKHRKASDLARMVKDSPVPFPLRLSKVFEDETSLRIIAETNVRAMSATQFHAEFGHELQGVGIAGVRRRFKRLEKIGWLAQVDAKTGGGGGELQRNSTGQRVQRSLGIAPGLTCQS